ncbi:hypothetical protein K0B96_07750 [Horticoccus luteus]|uniref:Glycosyl transferase n=1 Tax=Horticoccus luteus TaxID=2862869 RepID=A0A8F9TWN9_9BACT|nr:hypothetical protein [Horticoccus luteus]QYM80490.1 hypothetical protein K0B96_07750 [Horticoccus luteus]
MSELVRARALAAIPPPTTQYRKPPLTAGRLLYLLYFAPRGALKKGVWKTMRGARGRRAMQRALPDFRLPEPPGATSAVPIDAHFLIGARYLPEACLVAHSLAWASGRSVVPHFYDDGTLTSADCDFLRAKLPRAQFTLKSEIGARLDEVLPAARFPCLRKLRPAYPHIRKLTDIHLFPGEWKLVSDADVLFFARPAQLLDAMAARRPVHMVDVAPAYGVPQSALERLAGCPVHEKINVGLCHLRTPDIDWDFVEHCAATLLAEYGFTYYLEQALTATLLARAGAAPLNPADYVVYPTVDIARRADCAAIHYVDDSRSFYYDFAWRQVLARSR